MMSAIFVFEAIVSIMYAEQTKTTMAEYGIFWKQDLLLYGSITMLIIGALMLLIGYRVKFGVWLLLLTSPQNEGYDNREIKNKQVKILDCQESGNRGFLHFNVEIVI